MFLKYQQIFCRKMGGYVTIGALIHTENLYTYVKTKNKSYHFKTSTLNASLTI